MASDACLLKELEQRELAQMGVMGLSLFFELVDSFCPG